MIYNQKESSITEEKLYIQSYRPKQKNNHVLNKVGEKDKLKNKKAQKVQKI